MSALMTAPAMTAINFAYDQGGEVRCLNAQGLTFFLQAEPPLPIKPAARSWKPVESTHEVAVRREADAPAIVESARTLPDANKSAWTPVEATHEVEVRRDAPAPAPTRGTGALPDVPLPGKAAEKGWFNKLFKH